MVYRFFCLVHATTIYFELYFATGMTEINEETKKTPSILLAYYGPTDLGVMPKGPASGLGIPDRLIELHGGSLACIPRLICRAGSHHHPGVDDVSGENRCFPPGEARSVRTDKSTSQESASGSKGKVGH